MIQKNKKLHAHSRKTWVIAILISMTALYAASLFTPFLSGFAWFPIAHVQCGAQPYIASDFSASQSYTVPGDGLYKGPDPFTTPDEYYCSKGEVEAAHYRPHEWGERCRTNSSTRQTHCANGGNGYLGLLPFIAFLIIGGGVIALIVLKFLYKSTETKTKEIPKTKTR